MIKDTYHILPFHPPGMQPMTTSRLLENEVTPDKTIDAKHLLSPVPLLRLKKALAALRSEQIIRIDCTDLSVGDDISSWCARVGHTYLGEEHLPDYYRFFVAK